MLFVFCIISVVFFVLTICLFVSTLENRFSMCMQVLCNGIIKKKPQKSKKQHTKTSGSLSLFSEDVNDCIEIKSMISVIGLFYFIKCFAIIRVFLHLYLLSISIIYDIANLFHLFELHTSSLN